MSIPSITELSLLKCLWKQHPLSARAIHQHAEEELHWSFSSTRKTLERMLQPAFALRAVDTSPHPVNPAAESLPQWLAPLQRMHITSYFGTVRTAGATPHGGIDLAARAGTPIMAPASGTVTASTDLFQGEAKYGEAIAIEHAAGLRSVYAHLKQRSVKVGQAVAKGQLIGHTGATGRVSGPHLHVEIHRNNIKLDPELLLGSQDGTDSARNARDTQRSR
ncbi:peptidoglycan DD-metalloendopeptidase family protein [Massilia sp. DJPM01]|uniref:peptidoglycan DD-metalloendopeptidase family protein n=1 Tax=Massilia sp. DJPM01 TaxID=3024404 RepID=UPI00259E33DA|nr:peptidoglycan DD-metalloendopeptidase family protein [Massilia sp. DJPM01]MDM5177004.1 peptidoglycan DD-metalloendopeptidase family protein [Massilia sp. DJPM01]